MEKPKTQAMKQPETNEMLQQFVQLYNQAMQLQQLFLAGKLPPDFSVMPEFTNHRLIGEMIKKIAD
ncbi:MAG: hypothetical protein J0L83_14640 [Chitinophagales bacterium]|nr:hypothetical protein [Chitinophagales bacterium]